jgi:uridine phosphorylase
MITNLRPAGANLPASEMILRADGSLYHLGIRPEHVADHVVIVGDPERVPLVSEMFDTMEYAISSREFVVHTGTFQGKRITVVSSGIGVDNIDIVINELDAAVNIDLETRQIKSTYRSLQIVRIGTCGTLQRDIAVGSVVASRYTFALDGVALSYQPQFNKEETALLHALQSQFSWLNGHQGLYAVSADEHLFQQMAKDYIHGITATANGFYGPQGRSLRMQSNMDGRLDQYADFAFNGVKITNLEMECAGIYALASLLGHKACTVCLILANRITKEFHKDPSASMQALIRQVLERF